MELKQMQEITAKVMTDAVDVYDKDAVLQDMFAAGVPFGKLQSLYKSVGVKEGLMADPAEIKESIENAVDEAEIEEFDSYGDLEELASSIAGEIDGANESAVIRAIKAFCKDNGIDVPAKSKAKSKGRAGGGKISEAIITYFVTTPTESITKRGMYDAILPCVKGPRNAYDNVVMHFLNAYAIKAALPFDEAVEKVKGMDNLDLDALNKEFDETADETQE